MSSDSSPNRDRVGINKLPVEMLRHIFIHAAANDPHRYICDTSYITASEPSICMGWISITHVCHLWREVALATQSLWTDIILNFGQTWAEEMVRRSGPTAPISILVADCRGWDEDMYEIFDVFVPPMIHRVERLELWGDYKDLRHMYARLMSTPAPALRSLRLSNAPHWRADDELDFNGLFARHTPLLSTLRLYRVGFPATSFYMFENLKHFELHSGEDDSDVHPSPAELVTALARMPLLETLSMTGCVLSDLTVDGIRLLPSQQFTTVKLPNLCTLTMEGHTHVLDYMRRRIEFPASCEVVTQEIWRG